MNINNPPSGYAQQLAWSIAAIQQLNRRIGAVTGTSVTSVFGRTGDVLANSGDYTFAQLAGLPSTLAGYGISDGVSISGSYSNPVWITFLAWGKITGTPTTLSGYGITDAIPLSQRAANNGVATLDNTGKVPLSQLPTLPTQYKGLWNAATNSPTLANGTGTSGDFYFANISGTTNFGAGGITFSVGDVAIYNGTIWQRNPTAGAQVNSDWTSSTGASQILNKPVTFTALGVNMSTAKLLGRWTAGSGIPQEVTISTGLNIDASGNLTATAAGVTIDNIGAGTLHTIPYAASTTFDGNNGVYQKIILTGNTSLTISNLKIGIIYNLEVIQDASGNRLLTFATLSTVAYNGLGTASLSPTANACDILDIRYNGSNIRVRYDLKFT